MKKVLFVGGTSIGHIAPSVAVMQQLKKLVPNVECHFICLPSEMEMEYLKKYNCNFSTLKVPRFSLSFPWKLFQATAKAAAILTELKPDAVFCKGGRLGLPVGYVAKKKGIPIVLHESDAVSGNANKIVMRWADKVCTGFPLKEGDAKFIHTGNPIREEVTEGKSDEGFRITGFSGDRPILMVIGGSQGSQSLNEAVSENIDELLIVCDVIHLTGLSKHGAEIDDARYFRREFVYGELPHLYAISDLALSRAGANVMAELSANDVEMIIVPLRGVGHDHQQKNAVISSKKGECTLLSQSDLNNTLVAVVKECLQKNNSDQSESQVHEHSPSSGASLQIAKILSEFLA